MKLNTINNMFLYFIIAWAIIAFVFTFFVLPFLFDDPGGSNWIRYSIIAFVYSYPLILWLTTTLSKRYDSKIIASLPVIYFVPILLLILSIIRFEIKSAGSKSENKSKVLSSPGNFYCDYLTYFHIGENTVYHSLPELSDTKEYDPQYGIGMVDHSQKYIVLSQDWKDDMLTCQNSEGAILTNLYKIELSSVEFPSIYLMNLADEDIVFFKSINNRTSMVLLEASGTIKLLDAYQENSIIDQKQITSIELSQIQELAKKIIKQEPYSPNLSISEGYEIRFGNGDARSILGSLPPGEWSETFSKLEKIIAF